jgi:hypothetical protein
VAPRAPWAPDAYLTAGPCLNPDAGHLVGHSGGASFAGPLVEDLATWDALVVPDQRVNLCVLTINLQEITVK